MENRIENININDIFGMMGVPLCIIKDAIIIKCNKYFREEFCRDNVDPIGKTTLELKIWLSESEREEALKELQDKSIVVNKLVMLRNKNGAINKYYLSMGYLNNSEYIIGSTINITELLNKEEKYIKLNSKYEDLLNATKTSAVLIDSELNIKECNKNFLRLIESNSESIVGTSFLNFLKCNKMHELHDLKQKMTDMVESKSTIYIANLETQISTLNDGAKWILMNMSTYGDDQIAIIINEITDKKMEEAKNFIKSEKQKDKLRQTLLNTYYSLKNQR